MEFKSECNGSSKPGKLVNQESGEDNDLLAGSLLIVR